MYWEVHTEDAPKREKDCFPHTLLTGWCHGKASLGPGFWEVDGPRSQ